MDDIRRARYPERAEPFWQRLDFVAAMTTLLLKAARCQTNVIRYYFQPYLRLANAGYAIKPKNFITELKSRSV